MHCGWFLKADWSDHTKLGTHIQSRGFVINHWMGIFSTSGKFWACVLGIYDSRRLDQIRIILSLLTNFHLNLNHRDEKVKKYLDVLMEINWKLKQILRSSKNPNAVLIYNCYNSKNKRISLDQLDYVRNIILDYALQVNKICSG